MREGKAEAALRMIEDHAPIHLITQYTGLSIEDNKELQSRLVKKK
jgi:hypothetical protein